MSRVLVCALFILALFPATWAAESEDVKQVRDRLNREFDGHAAGDPDQIMSNYAPSFVGYWANGRSVDNWTVAIVGLDSLRSGYAAAAVAGSAL